MTDKQRLDAYVQAAMAGFYANPLIATETHNSEQLMKFIFEGAKDMMDYVDAQEMKAEPKEDTEGWITNVGSEPINLSERVDFMFRDGHILRDIRLYPSSYPSGWRWDIDDEVAGDIIKWRKAQ